MTMNFIPARKSISKKRIARCGMTRPPLLPPGRLSGTGDFDDDGAGGVPGTTVISKPKQQTKTPSLYRVILMNDDFTPMDFVIHVIQKFFDKDSDEATRI